MTNKRQVRRDIWQLQRIKTWQLVVLLIIAGLIAATFLRLNNIGMVERRDAVLAADEHGSSDDIKNRLYDLQRHASAHMNSSTGQFYLEKQYKRDSQKAIDSASGANDVNGNVYKKASDVCDGQFAYYSTAYLQCFLGVVNKYPAGSDRPATVELPPSDLYRHEFLSPSWSPDFAGWSLVVCVVIALLILLRQLLLLTLKLMLRRRYRSI